MRKGWRGCQLEGLAYLPLHCLKLVRELCHLTQHLVNHLWQLALVPTAICFVAQLDSHLHIYVAH